MRLRLKELGKKNGYSQVFVGDFCGVCGSTVQFWETGRCEPKLSSIFLLAELFNITVEDLVERS